MKKYLIFDLDGTLIKSNHNLIEFISNFMEQKYSVDKEALRYFFSSTRGVALRTQIMDFMKVDENTAKEIAEEIYKIIQKDTNCVFFPGVVEKILQLAKTYTLFLSTGNSTPFAKERLESEGLLELFSYVLGSENVLKGSEHINIFKDYTGDLEFEKYAIFIGDGQKDREIAQTHKMDFIHIDEKLENTYNDIYEIKSVAEISEVLKNIN